MSPDCLEKCLSTVTQVLKVLQVCGYYVSRVHSVPACNLTESLKWVHWGQQCGSMYTGDVWGWPIEGLRFLVMMLVCGMFGILTWAHYVIYAVMPSAMGIPAQGMSAVPMQRAQQYKINPTMRNPQQPPVAGQPMPAAVRLSLHLSSRRPVNIWRFNVALKFWRYWLQSGDHYLPLPFELALLFMYR